MGVDNFDLKKYLANNPLNEDLSTSCLVPPTT